MRIYLVFVVAIFACKKSDECQRFADKARPVMKEMMEKAGRVTGPEDEKKFLDECRKHLDKAKSDPIFQCVLGAKDEAAVRKCFGDAASAYKSKAQASEANLQLNKLGKLAKTAFVANTAYPKGKAGPTPAKTCCETQGKCPVSPDWATNDVWKQLDFQIDEATTFRYSYESADGKTAVATAVGDLDCDGVEITYKLELGVDAGGNPTMALTPPPNTD